MLIPAHPEDTDAVVDLLSRAFTDYALGLGRDGPGPYDWVGGRVEQGDVFWLGHDRQGVVLLRVTPPIAKIDMLGIDPQVQGTGLGGRALAAIESYCRDLGLYALHLQTAQRFTRLVSFYSRHDYRVQAVGPHPDGFDDLLRVFLTKRL